MARILKAGDLFTIAGFYKKRSLWKFWLWGKPKELKIFKTEEPLADLRKS